MNSISAADLIAQLGQYPADTQIYMAKDEEGNAFSTIGLTSIDNSNLDRSIIIYPRVEGLDYSDVFPRRYEEEEEEDSDV